MNRHCFAVAVLVVCGSVAGVPAAAASSIATLATVQVRPDAGQLEQQAREAASRIPTLAAVDVRPAPARPRTDADAQRAGRYGVAAGAASSSAEAMIITLPTVQVRPGPLDRPVVAFGTAAVLAGR